MGRAYVSNKWKSLGVRHLKFKDGLFIAQNEEEEKIIEGADGFGVHIHYRDTPEEVEAQAAVEAAVAAAPEAIPVVRLGRRGSK